MTPRARRHHRVRKVNHGADPSNDATVSGRRLRRGLGTAEAWAGEEARRSFRRPRPLYAPVTDSGKDVRLHWRTVIAIRDVANGCQGTFWKLVNERETTPRFAEKGLAWILDNQDSNRIHSNKKVKGSEIQLTHELLSTWGILEIENIEVRML